MLVFFRQLNYITDKCRYKDLRGGAFNPLPRKKATITSCRDSTEVERRTADSKVSGSNPGGGATKIIRSFHNLFFDSRPDGFVCSLVRPAAACHSVIIHHFASML